MINIYKKITHIIYIIFSAFFKKHNVDVMSLQELFHFITDPTINENNMDEYLEMQMKQTKEENDSQWQIKEAVFKQAYIPQKLTEVSDIIIIYNI